MDLPTCLATLHAWSTLGTAGITILVIILLVSLALTIPRLRALSSLKTSHAALTRHQHHRAQYMLKMDAHLQTLHDGLAVAHEREKQLMQRIKELDRGDMAGDAEEEASFAVGEDSDDEEDESPFNDRFGQDRLVGIDAAGGDMVNGLRTMADKHGEGSLRPSAASREQDEEAEGTHDEAANSPTRKPPRHAFISDPDQEDSDEDRFGERKGWYTPEEWDMLDLESNYDYTVEEMEAKKK